MNGIVMRTRSLIATGFAMIELTRGAARVIAPHCFLELVGQTGQRVIIEIGEPAR